MTLLLTQLSTPRHEGGGSSIWVCVLPLILSLSASVSGESLPPILANQNHASAGTLRNGATLGDLYTAADFLDERKWVPERRIRFSVGSGTLLTNDFRNCNPQTPDSRSNGSFEPISLVCKLTDVNGRPAVKLSDNFQKALGPAEEIERYRRSFGLEGVANIPVLV